MPRPNYLDWILAILLGCLFSSAGAGGFSSAMAACGEGQIPIAGQCVAAEEVNARIDEIVREAMANLHLKAVIAGFSAAGRGCG